MLDENLPTFYIRPSTEKPKSLSTVYYVKGGEEPEPSYNLRHLDPSLHGSRNRYAVGLYDSFVPDVLYAEALLIPKWTQPSLSQDAIRANGGVPPPPEPILPTEFTIQLYNPEQQILVRHRPKSWNSPPSWEFEMPQQTFRTPSTSVLDRTMSDPSASEVTPKLRFTWRKDSKLSKDLCCYLSGKTTNPDGSKNKSKEPDITIAIFKGLKEITLYEPNLYRVEMEDFKGLEVAMMLGAVIIRDVYFGNMKECFHISDPGSPNPTSSAVLGPPVAPPTGKGKEKMNGAQQQANQRPIPQTQQQVPPRQQQQQKLPQRPLHQQPGRDPQPPPADPRTQWEIDAESRRLKQQTETEARERRRQEKEREKRTKKLLEAEKKEDRKRQAQVEQETARLQKVYGKEDQKYWQQRQQSPKPPQGQFVPPTINHPPRPATRPAPPHQRYSSVPSIQGPGSQRPQLPQRPSTPGTMATGGLRPPAQQGLQNRSSIMNLFKSSNKDQHNALMKKRSSLF